MTTTVLVDFNYLEPFPQPIKQPIPFNINLNLGNDRSNLQRLSVRDVRSFDCHASGLDIERAGFQYVKHKSDFITEREGKDFADHDQVPKNEWKDIYASEIKDVIQKLFPQRRIQAYYPLGHVVRVSKPETTLEDSYNSKKAAGIAPRVHIDLCRRGARNWLGTFGQEALNEALEPGKRLLWFSVWRPLKTVLRDPLGVVDARTVDPKELCRMQRPFTHWNVKGENVMGECVICGPTPGRLLSHQWYYMSEQTPEDVVVFKLYDSKDDSWEDDPSREGARLLSVLHSSFELEGTEHLPMRESVEYRVAVVMDQ